MVLFKGSSSQCVLLHFSILLVLGPAHGFILSSAGACSSGSSSVLGHAAQCQHIKADVAYTHRFVQVKFDDGDLFCRALMAEQTATMAATRERKDNKEWVRRWQDKGRWQNINGKKSYNLKRKKGMFTMKGGNKCLYTLRLNPVRWWHTSDVSWWWLQIWSNIQSSLIHHTTGALWKAYLGHSKCDTKDQLDITTSTVNVLETLNLYTLPSRRNRSCLVATW